MGCPNSLHHGIPCIMGFKWEMVADLGPSKAAEGSVGGSVGLADVADRADVGDPVAVVAVQQCAVHDRVAEVQRVACIVVQVDVQRNQPALLGEADLRAYLTPPQLRAQPSLRLTPWPQLQDVCHRRRGKPRWRSEREAV